MKIRPTLDEVWRVKKMIKEAIVKIVNKQDLSYDEAYAVMNEIMSGETTPTQNAAFLAALSTKSAKAETTDEIAGCAAAMRDHATKVDTGMDIFEIVGTGGDNAHSFNISTTGAGSKNGGHRRWCHCGLGHHQTAGTVRQGCTGAYWRICKKHEGRCAGIHHLVQHRAPLFPALRLMPVVAATKT